jgi:DNA (cytosine-5)-methyltransferase 1
MPTPKRISEKPTLLDLFCGCGGFSLGFERAGFRVVAAIDYDRAAIETFKANRPDIPPECVLERDLTAFPPEALAERIGTRQVDLILGGPPCQGFSSVRQVDGANSGKRLIHDPRRELYRYYFQYIKYFRPVWFVMENVPGLRTMSKGHWWTRIRAEARRLGYRLCPTEFIASDFGVPQRRHRLLVVGTRKDSPALFHRDGVKADRSGMDHCRKLLKMSNPDLRKAIADGPCFIGALAA